MALLSIRNMGEPAQPSALMNVSGKMGTDAASPSSMASSGMSALSDMDGSMLIGCCWKTVSLIIDFHKLAPVLLWVQLSLEGSSEDKIQLHCGPLAECKVRVPCLCTHMPCCLNIHR